MSIAVTSFLVFVAAYIIVGWGIYLVYRAGQISVLPVISMAMGAYLGGYLGKALGWPFGAVIIPSMALGALFAFLLSLRLNRLPAFTTAIITIAFMFLAHTVIGNLDSLGGLRGLIGIPKYDYVLPVSYAFLVIVGTFVYRLDHSRFGRAMSLVFVNQDMASSLGIDIAKLRIAVHVISGALGALGGVLYAFYIGSIHFSGFGFSLVLFLFVFLIVGGATTMWGLAVFTPMLWAIVVFLPENAAAWKDVIFGCLLIAFLMWRLEGVIDRKLFRVVAGKLKALVHQSKLATSRE